MVKAEGTKTEQKSKTSDHKQSQHSEQFPTQHHLQTRIATTDKFINALSSLTLRDIIYKLDLSKKSYRVLTHNSHTHTHKIR